LRVLLKTLGCRLNEAELDLWARALAQSGHGLAQAPQDADAMVLNTCGVTAEAARKSRKALSRLHRENPQAKLVATGCYATLDEAEVAERLGVDAVLANAKKADLVQVLEELVADPAPPSQAMAPSAAPLFASARTRAFIKIQDGCRNRCSFCIVTVARGDEKSRTVADLVSEVQMLANRGVQEIVLTGVHIGGYGRDLGENLHGLLRALLQDTDMPRIRLGSLEPWELPEGFFSAWEDSRLLPHLHLPLQSGSDRILRRMARRTSRDSFRALVHQARDAIADVQFTTDVIVGFPGEGEAEFQETLSFCEEIGFGHLHVFPFSPREGTAAARFDGQVSGHEKSRRVSELAGLGSRLKLAFRRAQVGRRVPVLFEESPKKSPEEVPSDHRRWVGYAPNYVPVALDLTDRLDPRGAPVMVELEQLDEKSGLLLGRAYVTTEFNASFDQVVPTRKRGLPVMANA
jgi:threonylcarbamoyladenosine tRNA methylthiotransferase MtaB